MFDWLQPLLDWLQSLSWQQQLLLGVGMFLVSFFGSIGFTAWLVIQIPATYFCDEHAPALVQRHPVVAWLLRILKNLAGLFLVVLGILMSFPGVPGQGALTILIGLMLLDFPGKRRLELWMIRRQRIHSAVNRLRQRFHRPPLVLNEELCPQAEAEPPTLTPQG